MVLKSTIWVEKETTETEKSLNENDLLRQSMSDRAAFRPIYEKHFKSIFLFVNRRIGERNDSADVTQQVFLKALTNLDKFQFRNVPFSAWLYRIAINECNDFFRHNNKMRTVVIEEEQLEALYDELTETKLDDLLAKLPGMLQELTPHELQLIEMRYFEARSFKEIADIVGITENHTKVRVYRTLKKLKNIFMKI